MCLTLVTHLSCSHTIRGPIFQCAAAAGTVPRGAPHDDGRLVLCQPGEIYEQDQNTTCERCFSSVVRGILAWICGTCRRGVVSRMLRGGAIDGLLAPQRAGWSCSAPVENEESESDASGA